MKKLLLTSALVFMFIVTYAEGSKDLYPNGCSGKRAFLQSRSVIAPQTYDLFPTLGTMKVYVIKGEILYLGSSAQGIGNGTINVRKPSGATLSSENSVSTGLIANRTQELNGPNRSGVTTGYSPYIITVDETGVWEIDFIAPGSGTYAVDIDADENWTQPNATSISAGVIAAFDVSVSDDGGSTLKTGRVYCNTFNANMIQTGSGQRLYITYYVLTNVGYTYQIQSNGQNGASFNIFVNNKGIQNNASGVSNSLATTPLTWENGEPAYKSISYSSVSDQTYIYDPRQPDNGTNDITHKIFFEYPSDDLPSLANIRYNGGDLTTTWLKSDVDLPKIENLTVVGIESGEEGVIGPDGTYVSFTSNVAGKYSILLSFSSGTSRTLTGNCTKGKNQIIWNGKNGDGTSVSTGADITVKGIISAGEVHFPMADVEINPNGIIIELLDSDGNLYSTTKDTVYWNDSGLSGNNPPNPLSNTTGLSSNTNGHKWGSPTASFLKYEYGDRKIIDTWSYVKSSYQSKTVSAVVENLDLSINSIIPSVSASYVGDTIVYSVIIENITNSSKEATADAVGATFGFETSEGVKIIDYTFNSSSGSESNVSSLGTNKFSSTINLTNGGTITYIIKAKVEATLAHSSIDTRSYVIRPSDVIDIDATSSISGAPTDPDLECNGGESGAGCNNIKNTATINVKNSAPIVDTDNIIIKEDTSNVIIDVQVNDTDADGDVLTTSIVTAPSNGTATVVNNDSITYTPNANFSGKDTIIYQVTDPSGANDQDTVFITVTNSNDAPVANTDNITIAEDTSNVIIDVQVNDTDADGDVLTTSIITAPSNGTATVVNRDSITYTPDANFSGKDTIIYKVTDPSGANDQDTIFITVTNSNDTPVATTDYVTATEDTTNVIINVQVNDTDADGDVLTTSIVTAPSNGTATVVNNDSITYTPNTNFSGKDTIIYQVADPSGASGPDTIFITVANTNDAPIAATDYVSVAEDTTNVIIDVQVNDTDADGDVLTTSIVTAPSNGTATVVNNDSITYTPNANWNGKDTIIYQVCDPSNDCGQDTIFITVSNSNDAPVATTDYVTATEDTTNVIIDVQVNDTDADGDVLTTSIVIAPSNGTVTVVNNDSITYTPNANWNGKDTIIYQVCDPSNDCDQDTIFITVTNSNDTPVAMTDYVTATEDTTNVIIDVQVNDTDADGDVLTTSIVIAPSNGTVTVVNNDSITYTPNANWNGKDTIIYQVTDPSGANDQDTVFITVTNSNDTPVAMTDYVTATEDTTSVIIDVQVNDTDADGDVLTTSIVIAPSNGTVTVVNNDSITYTPNANWNGKDTIIYQVCDPSNDCGQDTIFITVSNSNDAPVATTDYVTATEDTTNVIIDVQVNDTDADGDVLTTSIITAPSNGTATVVNNDSITYTPNANWNGKDTIIYQVCDPSNDCDQDTIFITVTNSNDAPVATTDYVSATEDTTNVIIDVQVNDTDADGDVLTTSIITAPSNGTVTVVNNDSITYTPNANWNGKDTIIYQVTDPSSAYDKDTVFITVTNGNDAPVAMTDYVTATEDTTNVIIDVQVNDTDADGDVLTTSIVTAPSNGTATVVNNDSITYTPNANFSGKDTIIYQVTDPSGANDQDTVFITVTNSNDAPVANTDNITIAEDTSNVIIDVQVNDTDADGDVLTTSIVTAPSNGTATVVNNDSITYTPNANFSGKDTIIYQVTDPSGANDQDTVFITVTNSNDAPVANTDNITIAEDTTNVIIDVQVNDTDADGDVLTTSIVTTPSNGTATVVNNDSITYTPNANWNGKDTIIYQVTDPSSAYDKDTIFITVTNSNDAPVATTDYVTATEDTTNVIIDVQVNDTDADGDVLTTSIVTAPSNGTATVVNNDSVTYTPNANWNGKDTIIYQVCDPSNDCDQDTIFITVTNSNDAPVATTDYVTATEDTTNVIIDVQVNDTDADGDVLTTSIVTAPSNGTATVVNNDSVTYTPNANWNGKDTIIYQVCDPSNDCDQDTIFITVTNSNDAPVATTDYVTATEDTTNVITDVQVNDTDADGDVLTTSIVTAPSNGTATVVNNDSITYTPNANFSGKDTIIYQVTDPSGANDQDTVFITVTNSNDAPVANTDNITIAEDTSNVIIDVQVNDTDADGDVLTTSIITAPSNGTATVVNRDSITYTPDANFSGKDTIIYKVTDPSGANDQDTIFITVTNSNDTPVAMTDYVTATEDTTNVIIDVQVNDTDADGDVLTTSIITAPGNGTATVVNNDSITYTPNANWNGKDTIIYKVTDPSAANDQDTVFITVTNSNDVPVAMTDYVTATEDTTNVIIDVQVNDTDADGDVLTTSIVIAPGNGTATVVNNDSITYTPNANWNGKDTIIYQVCDPSNDCDQDTIFITVTNSNDAPVATTDYVTATEDTTNVIIDVQVNDTDADGDVLTTSIVTAPSKGTATVVNNDSITYTPNANWNGKDTIIYQVADPSGANDQDTVFITVTNSNDAPVATTDYVTATEDTTNVIIDVQVNDTDADGDVLITSIVTAPNNGTVTVVNNDSITYTPNADWNGKDTIIYQVTDPSGANDQDTVFITVTNSNDAPVAMTDYVTATEDTTNVIIDVQVNDTDADGDVLTTSIITAPSNGTATVVNRDSITYTPDANFSGKDTIIYKVTDPSGANDQDTIFITVTNSNDTPVAMTDYVTATEDTTNVIIDVQVNDTDADGDVLTTSIITAPGNGTATVVNNDSITYTPNANWNGKDTIIYKVTDPSAANDQDTVFITVTNSNDVPVAMTDYVTATEDTTNVIIDVQVNDTDADGDVLTTSIVIAPGNGTATVVNNDSITYTPNANWNGKDTIIYQVTDPSGANDQDTVFITVTNSNDAPVATTDYVTATEDTTNVIIDVQVNDTDADGDVLTTSIVIAPGNGTATVVNNDSVTYTPNANWNGKDTIIYQVCDPSNDCDQDTIFITVTNSNDAPVATTDYVTATEDTTNVIIDVQVNDTDADGDVLTTSIITAPSNGTATVVNSDSITYTPDANFSGKDTIIYQVADPSSANDQDTVFITVTNSNDTPVAMTDYVTATEDTTNVIIDVQVNDTDADGDVLTTSIVTAPSNGTVTVVNNDSITYTPNANFSGKDTIIYQVCDPSNDCDQDTIFITVTNSNDAPVATTDYVTATEDTTNVIINVQVNDTDADGDVLTTSIVTAPSNGTATVVNNDSITYTPNTNFSGKDTIIYQVADPSGASGPDTIFITVANTNDAPIAATDYVSVAEDTTNVIIDVQVNDTDADGDVLTTSIVTAPSNGTATVVNNDSITYTPNANFSGKDTIIYQVADPSGASGQDTIFITVVNTNDAPIAATDYVSVAEDTTNVIIDVQVNDTDADGDVLTTSIITAPSNGTATVANNDSITYTPNANFSGKDTIIYKVTDPSGANDQDTVFITVTNSNDTPVATTDYVTATEDTTNVIIDVQVNDTDADGDVLTTSIVTAPSNGTATVVNNDSITYTPDANFSGKDTIIYQVTDPSGANDQDTVFITVTNSNDAPVANTDNITIAEDTSNVIIDVQVNDTDADGDVLTTSIVTAPSNGTATVVNNDSITYTPNTNFSGKDTIIYQVTDPSGAGGQDTIFITVVNTNDAPIAATDYVSVAEDTTNVIIDVQVNDTDADGDVLTTSIVTAPSNGTATVVNNDSITYTPNANFSGKDTIIYQVTDPSGANDQDTVFITVTNSNDAPVANTDNITIAEDTTNVIIDVQLNDTDADGDVLTTSIVTAPGNGTATVVNSDSITYTPDANFSGKDTIIYQVTDPSGANDQDTVFITVTNSNDAPVANTDNITIAEDTTNVIIDVQLNDTDADGDVLTTSIVTAPGNGTATVVNNDSITYTPNANWNGKDTIIYQVCDPSNDCDQDTIFITVTNSNDAPVAMTDYVTATEDTTNVIIDVQVNDTDADGDVLTTSIVTAPSNGTVTVFNNDSITYTPNANFSGKDTIIYQVTDPSGANDQDTVFITVTNSNDAPVATTDYVTATEDATNVIIDVQVNDTDADGDVLTTSIVTAPSNGTVTVVNNDSITYTPNANFSGKDTIIYQVTDPSGVNDQDTVFITVTNSNDAPVATTDYVTATEDTTNVIIDVQVNDTDADGDVLTTSIITAPSNGTATVVNNDSITYTPNANFSGKDTIIYKVTDPSGASGQDTIFITVVNTNDAPIAATDYVSVAEDTTNVIIDVQVNDTDADGDVLTTSIITAPSNGTATVVNNDSITYTPNANFSGKDTIIYKVTDPSGANDQDTVFITVTNSNDTPVAMTDYVTATEDTTNVIIDVQVNDTDADGDVLTTSIVTAPSNGTATVVNNDSITYTPNANWNGKDTIIYQVTDPSGANDQDTVFITVTNSNDAPVATTDYVTATEDTTNVIIDVQVNDTDADGDVLTTSIVTAPSNGTATVVNNDSITYTPDANFSGKDTIIYQVTDPSSAYDKDTVFITVTSINDTPIANTDSVTIQEDSTLIGFNVLDNDFDTDGDPLIINTTPIVTTLHGSLSINSDGTFIYTPTTAYSGVDSFRYEICDNGNPSLCAQTSVIITIIPAEDYSIEANNDTITMVDQTEIEIYPLVNDIWSSGEITMTIVEYSQNGSISYTNDDVIVYTPNVGYVGLDSMMYSICNVYDICKTAMIYIDVDGSINPPQIFTPNDDGQNDYFVIKGIEEFAPCKITIINRWGNKVYVSDNYNNDWDGTSNTNFIVNKGPLPIGTYYYYLQYGDNKTKTGFVYLKR